MAQRPERFVRPGPRRGYSLTTGHRSQPAGSGRDDRMAEVASRVGSRVLLESSQRVAEQSGELAKLLDRGRVQDLDVNRPVAVDNAVAEAHRVTPGNVREA